MMKNRPTEFTVMGDYIQAFGEKLGTLDRISQRILKEETGSNRNKTENTVYSLIYCNILFTNPLVIFTSHVNMCLA